MNEIETISIDLNGDQYAMLEKMLLISNARKLAMNQPIKCDDLFREILIRVSKVRFWNVSSSRTSCFLQKSANFK